MLSKADDFPVHQRAEPISVAGTDRNFYDRYFFNAQSPDGRHFLAAALGVYPHIGITDAAFCYLASGIQRSIFASRFLTDRMDTHVGPISVTVQEPLHRLSVDIAETAGLAAALCFTGAHPPILEPRFTHRVGTRTLMDVTRMTQNVALAGSLTVDGSAIDLDGWRGTRDRSWGVRPIGAADAQAAAPPALPQFFWLWAPLQFDAFSLYFHSNDDADGVPWNRSALMVDHASGRETRLGNPRFAIRWQTGTRTAAGATLSATLPDGAPVSVALAPLARFHMHGVGYSHPSRGHGSHHGAISIHQEQFDTASADLTTPAQAHVQTIVAATFHHADGSAAHGQGVLEQLAIGPHAPSGFRDFYDLAR